MDSAYIIISILEKLATNEREQLFPKTKSYEMQLSKRHLSFIFTILVSMLVYLYVDVVFALGNDLDIGIMDGLLVVLYAC